MSNNKALPLKLKDSDGNLQQINASDKNYIAYLAGIHTAQADSSDVGLLTTTASGNRLIGSLQDTYYPEPVGTHPYNASSVVATSKNLYQINGTASLADSDVRKPIAHYDTNIYEQNDTDVNSFVDEINSRIVTSDYAGSLKLSATAPSGDYTVLVPSILTDQRADSAGNPYTVNDYSIWRRTNMSAPTNILNDVGGISSIMGIKRSSGATGTYQGVEKLTDRQITQSIGQRAKTRRAIQGNVGSYDLRTSSQGAPNVSGQTWTAKGSATNTIRLVDEQSYTRSFAGDYARVFVGNYSDNYSRTSTRDFAGDYTGEYSRNYAGNYSRQFVGEYTGDFTGNYTRNFVGDYAREYVGEYVGNYVGDYTRIFTGDFTRNFVGEYSRTFVGNYGTEYTGNYTRERDTAFTRTRTENSTRDFVGNYSRNFVGNYAGNYVGEYTRLSTRTRVSAYTRTSTRTRESSYTRLRIQNRNSNYLNYFTRGYTRTSARNFVGNYAGAQGTGSSIVAGEGMFVGNYSRQFFRNFSRNSTRTYTRDRSESYLGNFITAYAGNYTGAQGTGASVVSGQNVFVGNYTRNRISAYYRNYTITRIENFTGNYVREYADTYSRNIVLTHYLGNFTRGFTRSANIESARMDSIVFFTNETDSLATQVNYVTTYFRSYTRSSAQTITKTYNVQHYTRGGRASVYVAYFTGDYTRSFLGNYTRTTGSGPFGSGTVASYDGYRWFVQPFMLYGEQFAQITLHWNGTQVYQASGLEFQLITTVTTGGITYTRGNQYANSGDNDAYQISQSGTVTEYTRTRVSNYINTTGATSENYTGNYIGEMAFVRFAPKAGEFQYYTGATNFTGDYIGNFVTGFARFFTGTSYMRNFGGGFSRAFTRTSNRAYTRSSSGNPAFPYTRIIVDTYTRQSTVVYTRLRNSQTSTRTRISTFLGNYTGAQGTGASIVSGERVFTGEYARGYSRNYTRQRVSSYTRTSTRDYVGNYAGAQGTGASIIAGEGVFVGNFSRTFVGNYLGNYFRNFAGNYIGDYTREFAGNYLGNYTRTSTRTRIPTRVSSYARTRVSNYTRSFVGNYTGDFLGNYTRNRGSSFTRARVSSYSRTRVSNYTRGRSSIFSQAYSDTYTGVYSRNFNRTRVGDYTRERDEVFSRTRNSSYGRTSTREFTRNSQRTRGSNYAGDYVGNYSRSRGSAYHRTRVSSYVGQTIGNTVFNVETYTLYVRTA